MFVGDELNFYTRDVEDAVSPSSTALSSFVMSATHVALGIWLLSILSESITSPALSRVLETSIFETSGGCSFKASLEIPSSPSTQLKLRDAFMMKPYQNNKFFAGWALGNEQNTAITQIGVG